MGNILSQFSKQPTNSGIIFLAAIEGPVEFLGVG